MRLTVRVGDACYFGRAVDVRGHDLSATRLARAVRGGETAGVLVAWSGEAGPLFDQVGVVRPGMRVRRRGALAAVARSLGRRVPADDERERIEARLASFSAPAVEFATARERVAQAGKERDRLRERVAVLRGRIQVLRDRGLDETDALAALRSAARALSEAETERAAATQMLDRKGAQAREGWDSRERRLALRDRADNLARRARAQLADGVRASVDWAIERVPESSATDIDGAPPDVVALASIRVATVRAPIVLACDRFASVEAAADWLDAPVVRVEV